MKGKRQRERGKEDLKSIKKVSRKRGKERGNCANGQRNHLSLEQSSNKVADTVVTPKTFFAPFALPFLFAFAFCFPQVNLQRLLHKSSAKWRVEQKNKYSEVKQFLYYFTLFQLILSTLWWTWFFWFRFGFLLFFIILTHASYCQFVSVVFSEEEEGKSEGAFK